MPLEHCLQLSWGERKVIKDACNLYQDSLVRISDLDSPIYKEIPFLRLVFRDKEYHKNIADSFYTFQLIFENPECLSSTDLSSIETLRYMLLQYYEELSDKYDPEVLDGALQKVIGLEESFNITNYEQN